MGFQIDTVLVKSNVPTNTKDKNKTMINAILKIASDYI